MKRLFASALGLSGLWLGAVVSMPSAHGGDPGLAAPAATYTFTTIDHPDGFTTDLAGINNAGEIVGTSSDAT